MKNDGTPVVPSNGRGALLVLVAFAVFSATDAIVKIMAGMIPPPQVTFLVTAAALVLLLVHALATGRIHRLVPRQPSLAFWRALLLALAKPWRFPEWEARHNAQGRRARPYT